MARKLAGPAGSYRITSKVPFQIQNKATPKYGLNKKRQRPLQRQQNGPVKSSNRPVREGFNAIKPSKQTMKIKRPKVRSKVSPKK